MATVQEHYERVLAGFYTWLYGGHAAGIELNTDFFNRHGITPQQAVTAGNNAQGSSSQDQDRTGGPG